MKIIFDDQNRTHEECPLCKEPHNKNEGDVFKVCEKHYQEIIDKNDKQQASD